MSAIRLQKIIAQAGLASRREAERLITEGRVQVNGERVLTLGAKADPLADSVKVNGKLITKKEPPVYLVLNKPKNVLTTMRDEEGKDRPTVADLLPQGLQARIPRRQARFRRRGRIALDQRRGDGEPARPPEIRDTPRL